MPVSRALRRLLRVLHLEEEEARRALESALGDLRRLEHALAAARERDRAGRSLVARGAAAGAVAAGKIPAGEKIDGLADGLVDSLVDGIIDRLAGLEESLAAARRTAALQPRIREAEQQVASRRELYLAKRVERRQAETLVEEAAVRDALEAARRAQHSLDDWHLNRRRRASIEADAAPEADLPPARDPEDAGR
jgi:flagellar biosynthesis chaperone FliJ